MANLLLHKADEAACKVLRESTASCVYVRYCDDMVLSSTDRANLERARDSYLKALEKLKLPVHPFRQTAYGKEFWQGKSKGPYRWGKKVDGAVPWLAFVGYQLRYDGLIRIRPSSIAKELDKQVRVTGEFLASVRRFGDKREKLRRSRKRLMLGLRERLEAMSVGRRHNLEHSYLQPEDCWCAGWACVLDNRLPIDQPVLRQQLRHLDRGRGRQLARARKALRKLGLEGPKRELPEGERSRPEGFAGKSTSYASLSELARRRGEEVGGGRVPIDNSAERARSSRKL